MGQPRVLLADDHRETAELLRGLLQSEFDLAVHSALRGERHLSQFANSERVTRTA